MTKMLRLVRNEWKKEFCKVATWVMVGLLAVCTVLSALSGAFSTVDPWISYQQPFEEFCQSEIEWYETMLTEGKDDEESLNFYRIEIEAYRIMLDAEMDWEDWRYTLGLAHVAAEAKYSPDAKTYESVLGIIYSNDPAAYFAWKKQNYEELYTHDVERRVIYTSMMDYCMEHCVIPDTEADWRYGLVLALIQSRETVLVQTRLKESGGAWSESALEEARNTAAVAQYRLDNGMEVNPADSFQTDEWSVFVYDDFGVFGGKTSLYWDAMAGSSWLLTIVSVLTVIVAGGTIANEFSSGTIKFLLMSPIRRWKILTSKYITVLLFGLGLCVTVWLLSAISALPLGVGDVLLSAVFAEGGEVYTVPPYLLVLGEYGLAFLKIAVMSSLAFAISALTRKASSAIAFTVFLDLSGSMISSMLYLFGFDWGRYLLFSNLDLVAIIDGTALFPHQSVGTAIVIIVLHMAVFLLTAHDAFVRREV